VPVPPTCTVCWAAEPHPTVKKQLFSPPQTQKQGFIGIYINFFAFKSKKALAFG
jgi:hypothetical protein